MIEHLNHDRASVMECSALELLRALPPRSIDVVLTDPPYGACTHANFGKEKRNDGRDAREALSFAHLERPDVAALAAEFARVGRGWVLVFTDDRSVSWWGESLEDAGGRWVRTGHWVKTNPMPQMTGDRPSVGTEPLVIAWVDEHRMSWNGGGHAAVWRGPREQHAEHPNQKPEWLLQALLGSFAPAGGIVLDPFLGSGSTIAAALRRDRAPGEIVADTSCAKCAARRAAEWAPPLPQDLRALGCDADPRWAAASAARITPLLAT